MGLFRAVLLRHIFRFAFERSEQLVGIRPSTCHPDETGIQFTVRLFRLTGAFLRGILFVDAVPDKKSGTDVKDVSTCREFYASLSIPAKLHKGKQPLFFVFESETEGQSICEFYDFLMLARP